MKVNLYNIYIFYPLIFFFSTKQKGFPLLYFSTFPIKQLEGELKIFLSLHFSISSHFFISQSNGPLVSSSNSIQQGAPIFVPLHLYLLFLSFWQIQQMQHIHRIIVSHFLAFVEKKKERKQIHLVIKHHLEAISSFSLMYFFNPKEKRIILWHYPNLIQFGVFSTV